MLETGLTQFLALSAGGHANARTAWGESRCCWDVPGGTAAQLLRGCASARPDEELDTSQRRPSGARSGCDGGGRCRTPCGTEVRGRSVGAGPACHSSAYRDGFGGRRRPVLARRGGAVASGSERPRAS